MSFRIPIPPEWVGFARHGLFGLFRKKRDRWGDPVLIPGWKQAVGPQPHPLKREVTNSMAHNRCFFCGEQKLLDGPSAPGAVNVLCSACGAKFNDMGSIGCDVLRGPTNPIPERSKGQANSPAEKTPDMTGIDLEGLMAR